MAEKEYTVVAPDGKEITLIGPVGASQEEVIAQAQKLYNPNATTAPTEQKETAFQAFVRGLKSPVLPQNKTAVIGPALAGLTGETIKQIGGATELIAPETGKSIVEVGRAINQGAAQSNPISTGVGQVGSYILPSMAAYKGLTVGQKNRYWITDQLNEFINSQWGK